jgi:hypothetical protein
MKFQIVFENSGDTIEFVSINHEVLEYYVDQLNQQNHNSFSSKSKSWANDIEQQIEQLNWNLQDVNSWINELIDWQYDVFDSESYLDQYNLNKLHADWVKSQTKIYNIDAKRQQYNFSGIAERIHDMFSDSERFVTFGNLVSKLHRTQQYDDINIKIHKLEEKFELIKFEVSDGSWQQFSNIFDKSILTNDIANFSLSFNHLGRTLYNKFQTFDLNLDHDDENSYNELLGFVSIRLLPAQTIPLSAEYQTWCQHHGRRPCGEYLNLGNIPDLHNRLTYYRQMIFKNIKNNNTFSIHTT